MALKAVVETLDGIPEALHAEYVKTTINGKEVFTLDVSDIDTHPKVKSLKTAHESVKAKRDEYKQELDNLGERLEGVPEDFNGTVYKQLKTAADGKGGEKLDEEKIKEIRADERKKVMKEVKPQLDRLPVVEQDLQRTKIDDGLTQSLIEAGVERHLLPAARALLKDKGKIQLVEDSGRFNPTVETGLGPQSLGEFVKDWVGTDEGKHFVAKATGGDANGSGGKPVGDNPFKVNTGEKINLTRVNEVIRENPDKAKQLARAANLSEAKMKEYGLNP
jgi:hypothetical protein